MAAINGFDSAGHYLRAGLIVNTCSQYTIQSSPDCTANFQDTGTPEDASAAASAKGSAGTTPGYADTRRSPDLRRLDAYLRGLDADKAVPQGTATPAAAPASQAAPAAPQSAAAPASQPAADDTATGPLLDYLMGG